MDSKMIQPKQAWQLMTEDGYHYLDVRTEEEFSQGHPKGAYNVPIAVLSDEGPMVENTDFLKVVGAHFDKNTKLIVGCKMGGRSKKASDILQTAGYVNILDQTAGFAGKKNPFGQVSEAGWLQEELPISNSALEGRSFAELKGR